MVHYPLGCSLIRILIFQPTVINLHPENSKRSICLLCPHMDLPFRCLRKISVGIVALASPLRLFAIKRTKNEFSQTFL
jgi:hypothetical protein